MVVARRCGVDTIRRAATLQSKVELIGRDLSEHETPMDEIAFEPHVDDDVLRLMFTACHPVLSVEARVALTLKMVAGLSTRSAWPRTVDSKPCLCPSSRRSLTRSVIPAPRRPLPP